MNHKYLTQLIELCSAKVKMHFQHASSKIVCEKKDIFGVVPHREEFIIKVLTQKDQLIKCAKPGDCFRIMKNVGGGSWRQLKVEKFKIVIVSDYGEIKCT